MTPTTKTIVLSDGREITLQTGKLAEQADGAVEGRRGRGLHAPDC